MKVLTLFTTVSLASAFTAPIQYSSSLPNHVVVSKQYPLSPLSIHVRTPSKKMAADDDDSSSRKRRKRKDGKQFTPPPTAVVAEEPPASASPPKQNTVVMQVRDIRDVLSGDDTTQPADATFDDDEELADDEEWEYYDDEEEEDELGTVSTTQVASRTQDDSMEQLLADARRMRASSYTEGGATLGEDEISMGDKVFDVISTIVTIDFFVVLGLLAWFLAGIFCSYVLKDDTVQIAFNMNFERVTQPALGLLMIGSIVGGESD
jgi:parvulin-like peptidyl-prolyl isomerase